MSESEKSKDNQIHSLVEAIKKTVQFVGIVGGAGTALAATAFGIGYLATKSHDAMLGLPTTSTNYTTYVRTGALFFSNSLHYLVDTMSSFIWIIVLPVAIFVLVSLVVSRRTVRSYTGRRLRGLILLYAATCTIALATLKWSVAPIHPENKDLLFRTVQETEPANSAEDSLQSMSLRGSLVGELVGGEGTLRRYVYRQLRATSGGAAQLRKLYSLQLSLIILLIVTAIVLRNWRLGVLEEPDQSDDESLNDRSVVVRAQSVGNPRPDKATKKPHGFLQRIFYLLVGLLLVFRKSSPNPAIASDESVQKGQPVGSEPRRPAVDKRPNAMPRVCLSFLGPLLEVLILVHLVLLPSNYGVLCFSNEYPCVILHLDEGGSSEGGADQKPAGISGTPKGRYLLSDLSVETDNLVTLSTDTDVGLYEHHYVERAKVRSLEVVNHRDHCGPSPNLLWRRD